MFKKDSAQFIHKTIHCGIRVAEYRHKLLGVHIIVTTLDGQCTLQEDVMPHATMSISIRHAVNAN
jgi:hypothetical protein